MTVALLMTVLAACSRSDSRSVAEERENGSYRTALAAYQAGRLEEAIAHFQETVAKDPLNGSARFQLACLLQDGKRDYAGAFCNYHEYLVQHPNSDKAKVAKSRLDVCERSMAEALANKHHLTDNENLRHEVEQLKAELKDAKARNLKLDGDLSEAMRGIASLRHENEKLMATLRSDVDEGAEETGKAHRDGIVDAKALLDKEEDTVDRVKLSKDAALLRAEGDSELSTGSALLPQNVAPTVEPKPVEKPAARNEHPGTYVVQDGDTLYKIAIRFYGYSSAWRRIREANKAVISTDGRVHAGQKIVLPK